MSIRNLEFIFRPRSVALIGASTREHSVGGVVAENLLKGGFSGATWLINSAHPEVAGVHTYPDVASLPGCPDLAVICTPAETVPSLIAQLGDRGTKGVVVVTAGVDDVPGKQLRQEMLNAARPHLMRIVGPNCLGVLSSGVGLNASFAQMNVLPGGIALVAQSGAILTTILDWASARGVGFSHLVSLGDMADVDFGDMLDYLAGDPNTHSIVLYIEAVTEARKFMSAARAAARTKPVIAVKAGRHKEAAKAALSHTGALAGSDDVYDAALRRAGILRVMTLDEVFDALESLATLKGEIGERLVILTNGGGIGVLATDALLDGEGKLADLSPATIARLDSVLPKTWSHGNPVDIIGDAPPQRYADSLRILLEAPEIDCILALNCPTAVTSSLEAAQAIVSVAPHASRPILTAWLGTKTAGPARSLFNTARVPAYDTPDQAVRGYLHLIRYQRAQEALREVPPSLPADFAPDITHANAIIAEARRAGETWLGPVRLNALLGAYKIPAPRMAAASTADGAAEIAASFGVPVALKIQSPDIVHKSDVGGVALGLGKPEEVRTAALSMLERLGAARPSANLEGFLVQEMILRPHAQELIVGMSVDPTFGPVLLFGQGGTAVEVIDDKALALPPLNIPLARAMMVRTRVFRQLQAYRDRPAANLDAIALTLVKLSQLVADHDEIVELDINPLLADEAGVIALDARVKLETGSADMRHGKRFAISPYPKELERTVELLDLGACLIRPVRPEDADAMIRLFERLTPEDIRLRFFSPWRSLSPKQLARFTQIDYDREMAFALVASNGRDFLGVVRLAADPDNIQAEFAVLVRSDLKGQGLGRMLMDHLIGFARRRGIQEIFGEVLWDNKLMLSLCRDLGFSLSMEKDVPDITRATLIL